MTETLVEKTERSSARAGLFGGLVSSKQKRSPTAPADESKPKKPVSGRALMAVALELTRARRGRLLLGLGLMAANRLAGLVLPWLSKSLMDNVVLAKGLDMPARMHVLGMLMAIGGGATIVQAFT